MPPVDEVARAIETEARTGRDWKRCRELVADLPPPQRAGYEAMLDWVTTSWIPPTLAPAPRPGQPLDEPARLRACRFALLALDAHTEAPAWSSLLLTRLVETELSLPGAEPSDLFKAMWELLLEDGPPLTKPLAAFVRALALEFLVSHRSRKTELQWLVDADLAVTPAEAFFKFQTLVLRPELYSDDVETEVLFQLRHNLVARSYLGLSS